MKMQRIREVIRNQTGQMAVELAVVMPVVLVVALIVINALQFMVLVARFDRVAPDAVLVQGVSPAGSSEGMACVEAVRNHIETAMGSNGCEISVSLKELDARNAGALVDLGAGTVCYSCSLTFHPWPTSVSFAGIGYGLPFSITHVRTLVVDRFRAAILT